MWPCVTPWTTLHGLTQERCLQQAECYDPDSCDLNSKYKHTTAWCAWFSQKHERLHKCTNYLHDIHNHTYACHIIVANIYPHVYVQKGDLEFPWNCSEVGEDASQFLASPSESMSSMTWPMSFDMDGSCWCRYILWYTDVYCMAFVLCHWIVSLHLLLTALPLQKVNTL